MKPGISVQHSTLPTRRYGLVRSDVAAVIGFITRDRWPTDASIGDFVELPLRRSAELLNHPLQRLFDPASRQAVRAFFENGGDTCHLYGVCIDTLDDLWDAGSVSSSLEPLFQALRGDEEIALISAPLAAYLPWTITRTGAVSAHAEPLYRALLAHCRQMSNRFVVLDAPRGLHGTALVRWLHRFRELDGPTLSYGALYYPWLMNNGAAVPPSGAVMGVFARTEMEHQPFGVVWPPANQVVHGVTHPEVALDWPEAQELATHNLNPIVTAPGRGVLVFGGRTLSTDSRWQFINTRRIACLVAEQLRRDNEWVVFETNQPNVWKILHRDVSARLKELQERGMLTGSKDKPAFMVVCDETNNPLAQRDEGVLQVHVDIQPITTTEHITIDLRLGSEAR